jgi:hypothetical protein
MREIDMTNAEHILSWAENSAPHWRRMKELRPGEFNVSRQLAYAAFQLASDTAQAMIRGGYLSRMDLEAGDLLDAARRMLEWRADNG